MAVARIEISVFRNIRLPNILCIVISNTVIYFRAHDILHHLGLVLHLGRSEKGYLGRNFS